MTGFGLLLIASYVTPDQGAVTAPGQGVVYADWRQDVYERLLTAPRKMRTVPRVTMKGTIPSPAMRAPLTTPQKMPTTMPQAAPRRGRRMG